ncbi:sigma-70 family RNA polymerase sigma factor [Dyella halodurans]|uniref:Sigma-70 family RNA polymerase sigma factor n=1 Tax=Dyella halodurans TaxID=1920171 RepID=A0ABV9C3E2_9GAMM|nr:sigma-70 family RNA polymerase sigma factor [Dyella halodurans]
MDANERQLWDRWRDHHDVDARSELVVRHSDWARQVARSVYCRIYGASNIWEDCAQNALIGLLESIDRFDPSRGVDFEPYARFRVRGSVFNGLRQLLHPSGRVSDKDEARNAVRERAMSIQEDSYDDPLEAFVATAVGLGLGFLLDAQSLPVPAAHADAYTAAEERERDALVSEFVKLLPEKERFVVVMHYYHHLPFVEVAERLKVTKGRISQLHKQALERLRFLLRDHWTESA